VSYSSAVVEAMDVEPRGSLLLVGLYLSLVMCYENWLYVIRDLFVLRSTFLVLFVVGRIRE
jgi:hypothetical protein